MSARLTNQLRNIVEAVAISSDTEFRVGETTRRIDFLKPATTDQARYLESPLAHDLQLALYDSFYTGLIPQPEPKELSSTRKEEHLRALRTANRAEDTWDRGWKVLGLTRHGVYATKSQRVLFQPHGLFVLSARSKELAEGESIDLRCHRDSETVQPSFYYAYSNIGAASIGNRRSIRFYWNCTPAGAVEIFREVSGRFRRFQIPYEMKCLARPEWYGRKDSLVLYLKPPYVRAAFGQVRGFHPQVAEHLHDSTPLFTRRIARGLSVAETPQGNVSFGHHRCGLVASALVRAHETNVTGNDRRLQLVLDEFANNDISLERPWLTHGEHDPFGIGEFELA